MKIYHYDPITKAFTTEGVAKISPKDAQAGRTVYLVPRYATSTPFPPVPAGKRAIWDEFTSGWSIQDIPPAATFELSLPAKYVTDALVIALAGAGYPANVNDNDKIIISAPATAENIAGAQAVIDAHDYKAARMAEVRIKRGQKLSECDYLILRHLEQTAAGATTTLSDAQYREWLAYRQALRDLPASIVNVDDVDWPVAP